MTLAIPAPANSADSAGPDDLPGDEQHWQTINAFLAGEIQTQAPLTPAEAEQEAQADPNRFGGDEADTMPLPLPSSLTGKDDDTGADSKQSPKDAATSNDKSESGGAGAGQATLALIDRWGPQVQAWAHRLDVRAVQLPTPGGIGLLVFAILFLLFAIVPYGNAGNTRLQLIWLTLLGKTALPTSGKVSLRAGESQGGGGIQPPGGGILPGGGGGWFPGFPGFPGFGGLIAGAANPVNPLASAQQPSASGARGNLGTSFADLGRAGNTLSAVIVPNANQRIPFASN